MLVLPWLLPPWLPAAAGAALRFVPLPAREQGIKSVRQLDPHFEIVRDTFSLRGTTAELLPTLWSKDIYMFMDGGRMASFMEARCTWGCRRRDTVFGPRPTSVRFLEFYSILVREAYRGRRLAEEMLRRAVEDLRTRHGLSGDSVLALHVSPEDRDMYFSARIYYRLGFRRAIFSSVGPYEFRYRIEELERDSVDLFELAARPEVCSDDGFYVVLHTRLDDFGRRYSAPADAIDRGRQLMDLCRRRLDRRAGAPGKSA